MQKRSGFTLIELLVVIAVIAILAAILFPVFVSARRQAQVSTCQSNLKQIGTALALYCDDNGGKYPAALASGTPPGFPSTAGVFGGTPTVPGLAWTLLKYTKNTKMWMCPAGAKLDMITAGPAAGNPSNVYTNPQGVAVSNVAFPLVGWALRSEKGSFSTNYGSWSLNRGIGSTSPDNGNGKTPIDMYNIWRTYSQTHEAVQYHSICGRIIWDSYTPASGSMPPFFSHKYGCNVLYYDGRVKFLYDGRRGGKDIVY